MQLIDPNHSAYRPLWVRVLIVVACFGWAIVESVKGDPLWAVLAGGAGAYSVYMLFITFNPVDPAQDKTTGPNASSDEPDQP